MAERAIEIPTDKTAGTSRRQQTSMFQRPRGSLTDEQETCIQHAAQKLLQRAEDLWAGLMSNNVNTYLGIEEWPAYSPELSTDIRIYIHQVAEAATAVPNGEDGLCFLKQDKNRARFVSENSLVATKSIFENLLPVQAVLTYYFWERLSVYSAQHHFRWRAVTHKFPRFCEQFATAIHKLNVQWAWPQLEVNINRMCPIILGLSDEEFKFLPLWAGGLDDGTGGVYQTEVPDAVRGYPIEPGPVFITGESIPDAEMLTEDGTTTIYTGEGTVTMTEGYSVQATRSHTIKTDREDDGHAPLANTTSGLSLVTSQRPTLNPNMGVDIAIPRILGARHIDEDFDWTANGSDGSDLSDLDCSDSDVGFEEIKRDDGDIEQTINPISSGRS